MSCAKERAEYTSSGGGGGTPKYAGKSAFSGAKSLFFSQMSVLIKGIAGGGLRQVDGSHVFQDFAPKNGRAVSSVAIGGWEIVWPTSFDRKGTAMVRVSRLTAVASTATFLLLACGSPPRGWFKRSRLPIRSLPVCKCRLVPRNSRRPPKEVHTPVTVAFANRKGGYKAPAA